MNVVHLKRSDPTVDQIVRVAWPNYTGKHIEAHYYNADHAFFNDTRPKVYSRADAHDAWKRTIEFLDRSLGFDKELPGGRKVT